MCLAQCLSVYSNKRFSKKKGEEKEGDREKGWFEGRKLLLLRVGIRLPK